jgi:protoporphyrinogen oxidase
MQFGWIAERVPRPDLVRVLANLLDGKDDDGWGPNARFRYPAKGGIGRIWRRVADRVGRDRFRFGRAAVRIDSRARRIDFADGSGDRYDTLVSTMPISRLVDLSDCNALKPVAARLSSSNVHVVGLGIAGELPYWLMGRKWIYFADPTLPFYRVTVLSNFAPANAPAEHWSLLAEISHSKYRPVDAASVVEDVIAGFLREGLIPAGAPIVSRFHHVAAPGYPTPTLLRDEALSTLRDALERLDIHCRGRFGAWRYEIANQDHCFLQGAELAGRLIHSEPEPTFTS